MVPDTQLVNKFSFSRRLGDGYPWVPIVSKKNYAWKKCSEQPKYEVYQVWANSETMFCNLGTHGYPSMRMKICLLSRCLGRTFVFCIFLSNQQEKSLFSDSADPSIFSDKMAVTSVLLYLLLLYNHVSNYVQIISNLQI